MGRIVWSSVDDNPVLNANKAYKLSYIETNPGFALTAFQTTQPWLKNDVRSLPRLATFPLNNKFSVNGVD